MNRTNKIKTRAQKLARLRNIVEAAGFSIAFTWSERRKNGTQRLKWRCHGNFKKGQGRANIIAPALTFFPNAKVDIIDNLWFDIIIAQPSKKV